MRPIFCCPYTCKSAWLFLGPFFTSAWDSCSHKLFSVELFQLVLVVHVMEQYILVARKDLKNERESVKDELQSGRSSEIQVDNNAQHV